VVAILRLCPQKLPPHWLNSKLGTRGKRRLDTQHASKSSKLIISMTQVGYTHSYYQEGKLTIHVLHAGI